MKNLIFIDTAGIPTEVIKTFLLTVSQFKDIKCELSPFDIDARRKNRPLLVTTMPHKIQSTDIYNYDELAAMGKEGYTLISANSLEEYANKLATQFKYC